MINYNNVIFSILHHLSTSLSIDKFNEIYEFLFIDRKIVNFNHRLIIEFLR